MIYVVIQGFHDLTDAIRTKSGPVYHAYKPGDTYPRDGLQPSEERILELCGSRNRQGRPLIAPACDTQEMEPEKTEAAGEAGKMPEKAAAGQSKAKVKSQGGSTSAGRKTAKPTGKKPPKSTAKGKAAAGSGKRGEATGSGRTSRSGARRATV